MVHTNYDVIEPSHHNWLAHRTLMDFERAAYATVCQHAISVVFDTSSSIAARPIRREARRFAVQLPGARPCAETTAQLGRGCGDTDEASDRNGQLSESCLAPSREQLRQDRSVSGTHVRQ
jgi:hypothetical protein